MTEEVVLVYFEGCPNAKRVGEILEKSGLPFRAIDQDSLPERDSLLGFSSPSVLVNGELIFGAATQSQSRGCTTTPLNETEFLAALRRAKILQER